MSAGFGSDVHRPRRVLARRGPGWRRSATDARRVSTTGRPLRRSRIFARAHGAGHTAVGFLLPLKRLLLFFFEVPTAVFTARLAMRTVVPFLATSSELKHALGHHVTPADAFRFDGSRCDRIVAAVISQLAEMPFVDADAIVGDALGNLS